MNPRSLLPLPQQTPIKNPSFRFRAVLCSQSGVLVRFLYSLLAGDCKGQLLSGEKHSSSPVSASTVKSLRQTRSMGRKAGGLYINPKKFGAVGKPCMKEMGTFLGCLSLNKNNDERCIRHKDLLVACVESQRGKPKNPARTINYHLQRLGRDKFL